MSHEANMSDDEFLRAYGIEPKPRKFISVSKIKKLISDKIADCEAKTRLKYGVLKVDRIDVVALRELYNDIIKHEDEKY